MAEDLTAFDVVKSAIEYAYNEASGLIRHSADTIDSYIALHPVNMYSDSESFRSAIESLNSAVLNEINVRIGDALNGFNVRISNAGYDFNKTSPTAENITELTALVSEKSSMLQELANSVASVASSKVSDHATNRPLLRPTGVRELPSLAFDVPLTFKYEFQNVGSKPWSGWMIVKLVDQYKNSVVVDFAPPNIPVVAPGDSALLSRNVTIPRVIYKDSEPRSWGDKTKIYISLQTRI